MVVSFVGHSGAGKTTLVERIVRELSDRGFSVSVIKFTHHEFDLDRPGKDSFRFKQAGAAAVGLVSPGGWAIIADKPDMTFSDLIAKLPVSDLIITEGGTWLDTPKIEVIPYPATQPVKSPPEKLIALVGKNLSHKTLPCFDRDDILGIVEFLIERYLCNSAL